MSNFVTWFKKYGTIAGVVTWALLAILALFGLAIFVFPAVAMMIIGWFGGVVSFFLYYQIIGERKERAKLAQLNLPL